MLMTAEFKDNGLFIPNIDKSSWQTKADKDGLLNLDIVPVPQNMQGDVDKKLIGISSSSKKNTHAGLLSQYANPELIPLEKLAVEMAIMEKYGAN